MARGLGGRVEEALLAKERAREALESELSPASLERARRDHHARRKPRPCGITIHTGVGCSFGCVYCYIWDMGFPGRPEPYPLSPREIAYALAVNPYVVPFYTFAAYGSVTEPFLPETWRRAIEYIREVYKHLRLPSQVSTKALLTVEMVEGLLQGDPRISLLITVVALGSEARRLEPRAPPAEERIRSAGNAAKRGLHVSIFMRPIIPGVTEKHAPRILELAREAGVREIVLGSLRVTPGILSRLQALGVRIPRERIPRPPRGPRDQVTIAEQDLKREIAELATSMGFRVHPTACSANVHAHRMPCYRCKYGPCYASPKPPGEDEVLEALEVLGVRGYRVRGITPSEIRLDGPRPRGRRLVALFWLREVSGLMVRVGHYRV